MLGSQGANKAEVKSQLFIHEVSDKQLTDNRDNYKKNRKNDGGTENQIFHSPFGMICLAAESPAQSGTFGLNQNQAHYGQGKNYLKQKQDIFHRR